MKYIFVFLACLVCNFTIAQNEDSVMEKIKEQREKVRQKLLNPEDSPLPKKDLKKFVDLEYFPIDLKYRVKAKFKEHTAKRFLKIKTTTERVMEYVRFAELTFEIEGQEYTLQAYQNEYVSLNPEFKNYLFIPFYDDTNALESYGGGRYIDFYMSDSEEIFLDFNLAYNPNCCYNGKFSCPIPPQENYLPTQIKAGVKDYDNGKKKK